MGPTPDAVYVGQSDTGVDVWFSASTDNGTYMDANGNEVQQSDIDSAEASGNVNPPTPAPASTPTQSALHSPSPSATVNSSSQGGVSTAGMSGLFTAVGGALASVIAPPKTSPTSGSLVYNAALGTYVPASAVGAAVTNVSSVGTYVLIGAVLLVGVLVFAHK